ncbi:MAG: PHP domain-containing protein [Saprospiraceae bacterium]|nr:PHP domain-containing protein [Saprospiraceae bacterium]
MITNKEIASQFAKLSDYMELYDENIYKIKSYQNAYLTIRKYPAEVSTLSIAELDGIKGIGKAISKKIHEITDNGSIALLDEYMNKTPHGVQEMMKIKGIGPKKIKYFWKERQIESVGELLYECEENRLVEMKGMGTKTQEEVKRNIFLYLQSKGKILLPDAERLANEAIAVLKHDNPNLTFEIVGEIQRSCPIINAIELITSTPESHKLELHNDKWNLVRNDDNSYLLENSKIKIKIHNSTVEDYIFNKFKLNCENKYFEEIIQPLVTNLTTKINSDHEIYKSLGLSFVIPEQREVNLKDVSTTNPDQLIEKKDLKGLLHCHSTYSDGINTIEEMVIEAIKCNFDYISITDHSQSAFYANGLKKDTLSNQWREIDALNDKYGDKIKILKGIESDILYEGYLDYTDDILEKFDVIIASIHSILKMDIEKATQRLIKAIENPYTNIIGHISGRLLLSRSGYPLHYDKIFDACAQNRVSIELNANPMRLDIDFEWIKKVMDKGVFVSINPDAHSIKGIYDLNWGIRVARKGGLTKELCLNTLPYDKFIDFCKKKI